VAGRKACGENGSATPENATRMKSAVDSSLLFDIVKGAPGAAAAQAALESALAHGSVCACAIVIAELGRYFASEQDLRDFLDACQVEHDPLSMEAALEAARIMRSYARNKGPRERVAPDFLIGAHAIRQADALLTTDAGFYRHYFDGLKVIEP
jgi:predicted nucleic acid-binding protein